MRQRFEDVIRRLAVIGVFCLVFGPTPASAQALVQNGDFSVAFAVGALPWTATTSGPGFANVLYTGSAANFLSFDAGAGGGIGNLSQTGVTALDTTHIFDLSFDLASFTTGGAAGVATFTVTYNAVTIFSSVIAGNGSFSTGNFAITNGTGPLVFSFSRTGAGGFHTVDLDNVVLTDLGVPEVDPGSAAAPLALCAGGVFLALDRRRVKAS